MPNGGFEKSKPPFEVIEKLNKIQRESPYKKNSLFFVESIYRKSDGYYGTLEKGKSTARDGISDAGSVG